MRLTRITVEKENGIRGPAENMEALGYMANFGNEEEAQAARG